jgi:hypothetical protein
MQDKKFKISVDDAKIRDLRSTANELARDMIMSARQYSTSSKQVIQDIEEQIRLIEKRNKLDQEIERTKIESKFVSGDISKRDRKEQLGQSDISGRTDELQVKLLREIVDTIRSTAREEIREDRQNVERQLQKSKTVDVLSPKGDAEQILRETIQRGELGETGRSEAEERRDFTAFGKGGRKADRALATVAGSQNEWNLAAMIAGTFSVGAGVAISRLTQTSREFETAAAQIGRHRGGGVDEAANLMRGMGGRDYSFSLSDVADRYGQYRTAGQQDYSQEQMGRAFAAERVLGLSTGDISSVAGTTRYSKSDPTHIIAELETHLRKTSQDISLLPELINSYSSAANNLLRISTGSDTSRVASGIVSLAKTTGATGVELDQWSQGVQGLGKTQNPMVRSMLMRAFREKYPDKSMFEIQAMMENPMAHLDVVGDAFSELQGQTGGDMARQAIHSLFGGQVSRSAILTAEGKGGLDFSKLTSDYVAGGTSESQLMTMDAGKYVPDVERSAKMFDYHIQNLGQTMTSGFSDLFKLLRELSDDTNNQQAKSVAKGMQEALEADRQKAQAFPQ